MPKMKTHRGAKKRFRITGTGKIMRARANKGHLLSHKTSKRKRRLRQQALVNAVDVRRVKNLLPYD